MEKKNRSGGILLLGISSVDVFPLLFFLTASTIWLNSGRVPWHCPTLKLYLKHHRPPPRMTGAA